MSNVPGLSPQDTQDNWHLLGSVLVWRAERCDKNCTLISILRHTTCIMMSHVEEVFPFPGGGDKDSLKREWHSALIANSTPHSSPQGYRKRPTGSYSDKVLHRRSTITLHRLRLKFPEIYNSQYSGTFCSLTTTIFKGHRGDYRGFHECLSSYTIEILSICLKNRKTLKEKLVYI